MVTTRNTRADVVAAAGRLFAEKGYHGTSMRDLGRELGLLGSSLYAHVDSKQDLLVEVVEEGARLFGDSATRALATPGTANVRLRALITGHIEVVLSSKDVVRTFLNEARMLDDEHRALVLSARDSYEQAFRDVIRQGIREGSFRDDTDPKMTSILVLSVLNAVQRWYQSDGDLSPAQLSEAIFQFAVGSLI